MSCDRPKFFRTGIKRKSTVHNADKLHGTVLSSFRAKINDTERCFLCGRKLEEARQRLTEALPRLQQTAAEEIAAQGSRYTVSARLEETEFPTREYDGFALPSGEYLALRVVIGEGAGKNWWCVVFPPLCTTAACDFQETAVSGGLGEEDLSLITEEDGGYVLRFRAVELWEGLRQWLGKH